MKPNAPITTRGGDLRDHGFGRVARQVLRGKFVPFGHYGGGPNLFIAARLLAWRVFGRAAIALAERAPARWINALRRRRSR